MMSKVLPPNSEIMFQQNMKISRIYLLIIFFMLGCCMPKGNDDDDSPDTFWKAGVARSVITPKENIWMSGYAARDKPAEGKLHDLWVKALALEDEHGNRAVFITSDLIGISRDISTKICAQIQRNHGIERSQIILSSSHTHSGPVINSNLHLIYPKFSPEQKNQIASYRKFLERTVVNCVTKAFEAMAPAIISSGKGIARFAVNRRNNTPESVLHSSDLKGPTDHTVPTLCVRSPDGVIKSLLFGYACHCTTLDLNQWNGDYAGFAQIELEATFPDCSAMFFAACAGDQNPEPRRLVLQAEQYGTELAAAVTAVVSGTMNPLIPSLQTNYKEIELKLAKPLTIAEMDSITKSDSEWQKRWAQYYLHKMTEGEHLRKSYPYYPVQTWKLGGLTLVALGGEVVVDYSIRLKKEWGNDLFVAAYSNDVMAYIPSERVLEEGGYEGKTSMRAYGLPSIWSTGIEERIIHEVGRQQELLGRKRQ